MNNSTPKKKVAVVTGANKGLGLAIVKILCKEYNGKVYLTSRDKLRGLNACEELRSLDFKPEYIQLDISDANSVSEFRKVIDDRHELIDILVNNAGILFLKDAKESKIYQAEQTIHINFFSLVEFTESMLEVLAQGARIVNISSSSGHLSRIPSERLRQKFKSDLELSELKNMMNNYLEAVKNNREVEEGWGVSPYVVSKVAVNAYTFMLCKRKALASKGITVNCVHPGYVISDMTRGSGSVTPDEAAAVPAELALRPSSGGLYAWHDGTNVPWDGPDPRGFIDGKLI